MKNLSPRWIGVMIGSSIVAAAGILALIAGIIGVFPRAHAEEADRQSLIAGEGTSPFVAVADEVLPAVVNISTSQTVRLDPSPFSDPMFREFFGDMFRDMPRERTQQSLGSGFLFQPGGYILTNNHVVEGAEEIKVTLNDGRSYNGDQVKIVGQDPQTDLAVIKIETTEELPTVRLGDSDSIRIGDWAIAVGNPFGLDGTLTVGIISAKGRTGVVPTQQRYQNFIQTDAAINFGNSGGPLCNIRGEVIGINSAITSPSGGNIGIGFAVPVNLAKTVTEQLITKGRVERGYLGIVPQELTPDIKSAMDISVQGGILVARVADDTPAEKAGLEAGDVILVFNGTDIQSVEQFREVVAAVEPGTSVSIQILRNSSRRTLRTQLAVYPENEEITRTPDSGSPQDAPFGMVVRSLSSSEREYLDVSGGVVIDEIRPGSPASYAGLQPGDVILAIDNADISDLAGFDRAAQQARSSGAEYVLVRVSRRGNPFFVSLRVDQG